MKVLIVVDVQKDFVDGALGTKEAVAIMPAVIEKVKHFEGIRLFTKDTHTKDYLLSQEGRNLPVVHCVRESDGWELPEQLLELVQERGDEVIEKPGFGSLELAKRIREICTEQEAKNDPVTEIELIGLTTDICVLSNAMVVKAAVPEVLISVDVNCTAGITPESMERALGAMEMCQIQVKR